VFGICSFRIPDLTLPNLTEIILTFSQSLQAKARIFTGRGHDRFLPYPFQFTVHLKVCDNDTVTNMIISRHRFGKHVPAATNRRGIIEYCYEGRLLQTNSVQGAFLRQQRFSLVTARLQKEMRSEECFFHKGVQ
jgi:hypothetical protein